MSLDVSAVRRPDVALLVISFAVACAGLAGPGAPHIHGLSASAFDRSGILRRQVTERFFVQREFFDFLIHGSAFLLTIALVKMFSQKVLWGPYPQLSVSSKHQLPATTGMRLCPRYRQPPQMLGPFRLRQFGFAVC